MNPFLKKFISNRFASTKKVPYQINIEMDAIKKVLIFCYMGIGNLILLTPMIQTLKTSLPNADVDLITGDNHCTEGLKGSSLINQIFYYNTNQIVFLLKALIRIRKMKYDLIIANFHVYKKRLPWLILLGKSKFQIIHQLSDKTYDWLYDNVTHPVRYLKNLHESRQNDRLLDPLHIKFCKTNPYFHIDTNDRITAHKILDNHGIKPRDFLIAIQPDSWAPMRWKRWPEAYYTQLSDMLVERYKGKVLIMGAQSEFKLGEFIQKKMHNPAINLMGETSVRQAAAILEKCRMLICNDSGLMHVGAAVGTHVFAIYGPTDHIRTAPMGDNTFIIRREMDCSPCHHIDNGIDIHHCSNRKCLIDLDPEYVFGMIKNHIQ